MKIYFKNLLFVCLLLMLVRLNAQLEYNNGQYLADNPYLISPAWAGIGACYQIRFSGAANWIGIENAPNTQQLSMDGQLWTRSGFGLVIYNDQNGFTNQRGAQLTFGHHITLDEDTDSFLSFGATGRYSQFNVDSSEFIDGILDPQVGANGDKLDNHLNFDVGFLYRYGGFYLSLNAANILDTNINLREGDIQLPGLRHYFIHMGYKIQSKFNNLIFEPSILAHFFEEDSRSDLDINFKFSSNQKSVKYWAGASLKMLADLDYEPASISPMLGASFHPFYVAYAFKINLTEIQRYSGGSHMITVGIDIDCKRRQCSCLRDFGDEDDSLY